MSNHGIGELTPRHPHEHHYTHPDEPGNDLTTQVDENGTVQVSEELLDQFLTDLGYTRTDTIEDVAA